MTTKRRSRTWLKNHLEDVLIVIGFVLIVIGSYFVNPILPWFVSGAECLIFAFILAWSKRK